MTLDPDEDGQFSKMFLEQIANFMKENSGFVDLGLGAWSDEQVEIQFAIHKT